MIKFKYNKKIEKEIFEEFIKDQKKKEVADVFEKEINTVSISEENDFIKKQIEYIKNSWEEVEQNFYNKLSDFYNIKIETPDLNCYLTRINVFPYKYDGNDPHFTAPLFGNPHERIRVIMHELCHYFQPIDLDEDIKEAIPVILNDHKKFQMFSIDKGHNSEKEQAWRKIIWDIYKKGGTIEDLKIK